MGIYHTSLAEFYKEICPSEKKIAAMKKAKEHVRDVIKAFFKKKIPTYTPLFYIQGSFKMKTMIRTKEDTCDLDDGVYLLVDSEPSLTSKQLQEKICEAVKGIVNTSPEHREKCVRLVYSRQFEIDLPVYYTTDDTTFFLATKNKGWQKSDPKMMVDWYNEHKQKFPAIPRIIRYLKAWCDHKKNEMPSGLAMTILACNAINKLPPKLAISDKRDDALLLEILKAISKTLKSAFVCEVPAIPYDDVFGKYTMEMQKKFRDNLKKFQTNIQNSFSKKAKYSQEKKTNFWAECLGKKFIVC